MNPAGSMTGGRAAADIGSAVARNRLTVTPPVAPSTLRQRLILADAVDRRSRHRLGLRLAVDRALGRRARASSACTSSLAFVTFPVWIVSFSLNKLYQSRAVERPTEEFRRIVNASLLSVGVMVAVCRSPSSSRRCPGSGSCRSSSSSPLLHGRSSARSPAGSSPGCAAHGQICRPILIVGTDADAIGLLHAAQRSPHLGYRVVGFVGPDDIGVRGGVSVLGGIDETLRRARGHAARPGVLISLSSVESDVVNRLTRELTDAGYHVALSSGLRDIDVVRFRAQDLGGRTLIYVEQIQRGGWHAVAKRAFDIVVAVDGARRHGPDHARRGDRRQAQLAGPGDLRPGAGRSRRPDVPHLQVPHDGRRRRRHARHELAEHNEADGPMFKMANDPRVTKVGALAAQALDRRDPAVRGTCCAAR